MNRGWAEKNKQMQALLKKATLKEGIAELLSLRKLLMDEMLSWRSELTTEDYSKMPYMNANGYHSKTIAYSIWHIMRIEDIVVNTLILNCDEILFTNQYLKKINAPIITTGNELVKEEIAEFSKRLDLDALYEYAEAVRQKTDAWLLTISYDDLNTRFSDGDKNRIRNCNVVSTAEEAEWLIDYWCNKDVKGLMKMPLSRHWIMHIEAVGRIMSKLKQ